MARRIPSLNQLRFFEAVARHKSFKEGARELCVTQAAVSHQIKALEKHLGTRLFIRGVRKVMPTPEAEAFARVLTDSFDTIASAAASFTDEDVAGPLKVSVAPTYGNRWLLPRLEHFRTRHPEIELQIELGFEMVDLANSDFDAAVRYGHGAWPDLTCIHIHSDVVGPVCTPQYVAGRDLPMSPREIVGLTLASSTDVPSEWEDWFLAAGLTDLNRVNITEHSNSVFTYDAALSGHAVCLADLRTSAGDVSAGRLVRVHPATTSRSKGIYVVLLPDNKRKRRVEAFAAWMQEDAEEELHKLVR